MPPPESAHRLRPIAAAAVLGLPLLLAPLLAGPAAGQDARLDAIEEARRADESRAEALAHKARALDAEVRDLRAQLIEAAGRIQDQETELSEIEETLAVLTEEEQSKAAALRDRHRQLRRTLSALQRIALQPSEALIAAPGSPIDTVRSALLLRVAVPAIEERAGTLRRELDDLAELRARITEERNELTALTGSLAGERQRLEKLIARKRQLRAETSAERQAAQARAERLAAEAASLRELLSRMDSAASQPPPLPEPRPQPPARARAESEPAPQVSSLTPPVGGNRLYGFQAPGGPAPRFVPRREAAPPPTPAPEPPAARAPSAGAAAPGRAAGAGQGEQAPGAEAAAANDTPTTLVRLPEPDQVRRFPREPGSLLMPARGRLLTRYGEPRADGASKGLVLATRPGAQVVATFDGQIVYAGPFRGYGNILIIDHGGQYHTLLAGLERIDAVTGQWVLAGEPIGVMAARDGEPPELYVELRREGDPINPLPWLATTGDKVRG